MMKSVTEPLAIRTNVLLTKRQDDFLVRTVKKTGKTKGQLIREGLDKLYQDYSERDIDYELLARIKAGWKLVKHPEKTIDYKAWVNYGRRF